MSDQQSQSWSQTQAQTGTPWYRLTQRLAPRMKFPAIFLVLLVLFLVDFFTPDPILWVDEVMLGLLTVLFGMMRKRKVPQYDEAAEQEQPYYQQPPPGA